MAVGVEPSGLASYCGHGCRRIMTLPWLSFFFKLRDGPCRDFKSSSLLSFPFSKCLPLWPPLKTASWRLKPLVMKGEKDGEVASGGEARTKRKKKKKATVLVQRVETLTDVLGKKIGFNLLCVGSTCWVKSGSS